MDDHNINDKRDKTEFKSITFSGYKKTEVCKQLIGAIKDCKIEPALYWSAEYICAGHYIDLWEIIIEYISKYIHLGNPKLPIYINMRIQDFKNILNNGYINMELLMRNNEQIRRLFCEIIYVLCHSKQKHPINQIKIKESEFNLTHIKNKLTADNNNYASNVFLDEDPKEIYIAINEFCYNLIKSKDIINCCYWLEWLIAFDNECNKRKNSLKCERREFIPVDSNQQYYIIWIIWDILLKTSKKHKLSNKIIKNLLEIFTLKFTYTFIKKRKNIIYFAISLLTEPFSEDVNIINNKNNIPFILKKIDNIYKQIKKNEHSPNTDYLFKGNSTNNVEKSIEKMDILKNNDIFIPRIN